jgi:hypothetical protein
MLLGSSRLLPDSHYSSASKHISKPLHEWTRFALLTVVASYSVNELKAFTDLAETVIDEVRQPAYLWTPPALQGKKLTFAF